MENTKIEWCDHTFNPWQGCRAVSLGCKNCYAEALTKRYGRDFRKRVRTSEENWKKPLRWDRAAGKEGVRKRVFSLSMGDWLDDEVPIEWLADFLDLVRRTPNLDWLLLTKRPENWYDRIRMIRDSDLRYGDTEGFPEWLRLWNGASAPENIWIGTTVEDQARADERIPHLLNIPARVRFLSCEPLLGPVDLSPWLGRNCSLRGDVRAYNSGIHWVIAGGESGHGARPMHPAWVWALHGQCERAEVPFLFKQWGEWADIEPVYYPDGDGSDSVVYAVRDTIALEPSGNVIRVVNDRYECQPAPGSQIMARLGKKKAGRQLGRREYNEFPLSTKDH